MSKKTFRYLFIIAASIVAAIALGSSFRSENTDETRRKPLNLNKTLTNEMSDTSDLAGLDKSITRFMQEWNLQGVSLSIMRNDSLLYAKGYGWADEEKGVRMSPGIILRMASVSKLLTATGIMVLQEQGRLSLRDSVFGPSGILNDTSYTKIIKDKNYYKITVEDLLRHKGGFKSTYGDPLFQTRTVMMQNRLTTPPDQETLVKCMIKFPLKFVPGTSQYYSNFGYLLLSMIIEKVSGESYEAFMQQNVLRPAGCTDFHIANNYYKEKYKNETRYHLQSNDEPVLEYNNSGREVPRCYGGNDIRALSGAGAWVGSTPELARFIASIDGRPEVPDILSLKSVRAMTEYLDDDTYSLGWNDTHPLKGWTRTGTLSGTSALIKYYPDGECWILITNTSTWKGPGLTRYTAELFRTLRQRYSEKLPARDFFWE